MTTRPRAGMMERDDRSQKYARDHGVEIQGPIKPPTLVISSIHVFQRFFRLGRWPERIWQARTSQITRVEIKLVISAAS